MIKKLLAKLVNWEDSRKSNWTKAMEAQGLSEDERKKIMDKAREDLKKGQMRLKDRNEAVEEGQKRSLIKLKKDHDKKIISKIS